MVHVTVLHSVNPNLHNLNKDDNSANITDANCSFQTLYLFMLRGGVKSKVVSPS